MTYDAQPVAFVPYRFLVSTVNICPTKLVALAHVLTMFGVLARPLVRACIEYSTGFKSLRV
jgi:hypothetical protein